ncbi:type II secretion system protein GspL [Legionella sp. W05-934-2]|uniref:type II secretion system protein GspL n=1 Tax=Legionella sp. W05-934-2 TaxID=1198649 RepID=UPI0034623C76
MSRTKGYLFITDEISEENAYPLVFSDDEGQVVEPHQHCRIQQLTESLQDCPLTIIIPARLTTLHHVTLPLLSDKKAHAAIPYALEDYSAQEVSQLHFAFDRQFYQNGQYVVLSCDKTWLNSVMMILHKYQIEPKHMTTAWFALSNNQCAVHQQSLLFRSPNLNGSIPLSMWPLVKSQVLETDDLTLLQFDGNTTLPNGLEGKTTISQPNWEDWVVQRLNQSAYISLNQGAFAPKTEQTSLKKSLWLVGGSFILWLITWLATHILSLHHINQEIKQVDDKIAVIYRQFFPGSKQVISPRFRINQKLKNSSAGDESALLRLLDQLANPLRSNQITPVQLTYQNQRITLKIVANDFSHLEKFMAALKKQAVKANQLDANRQDDKVEATVEIQS